MKTKSQVEKFFTQRLNHFDTSDLRTYEQRYFVLDTYWKKPSGPILLNVRSNSCLSGDFTLLITILLVRFVENILVVRSKSVDSIPCFFFLLTGAFN